VDSGYYDGGIKSYNISRDDKQGDLRREEYPFLFKSIEKSKSIVTDGGKDRAVQHYQTKVTMQSSYFRNS
jgi:hypothetical protein